MKPHVTAPDAALADDPRSLDLTNVAFALPTIPPAWHAEIVADNAGADDLYNEGVLTYEERCILMWTAERCGGPAVIADDVLVLLDTAGHDYRTALLADALTRDGEHTMATAQANELLEQRRAGGDCRAQHTAVNQIQRFGGSLPRRRIR